ALLVGRADQLLCDQVSSQGRAEEAARLVDGVCLQDREGEVAEEGLAAVDHLRCRRAQLQRQLAERFEVDFLPEVDRQRQSLVAATVDQPVEGQARLEVAVEREDGARHGSPFRQSEQIPPHPNKKGAGASTERAGGGVGTGLKKVSGTLHFKVP